ncbi:hydroxyacylglutathione hydrolase [Kordiimonas marina]|uniref:hydroxyacylglutathione hydrolase n=1 Tax=Kordiimonas marina TaxID=2872312 RepID=UPI001FF100C7|nr:hydroxyacylglutathione hydrolase [Kordiimonas marina]MCJ9428493.1 hydroxyacylglutathione hydrolase [Kordiimonas marina]
MLQVIQIPVLQDNYVYLLHAEETGETAVVDPAVAEPVVAELEARGWTLSAIFNTHHHYDHVGANLTLKEKYDLKIYGPSAERERIPGIDIAVGDGDTVYLGDNAATVYDVPGHTAGHIAYHFADADALFCGDTLFAMGCGRLFEGTPDQMWRSLSTLMRLPDDTKVYCAHEYTLANGRFALSVEPHNAELVARMHEVEDLRAKGIPTIPSTIGLEKATNPFLRPMSEEIQDITGLVGAPLPAVFAEVRKRKDNF